MTYIPNAAKTPVGKVLKCPFCHDSFFEPCTTLEQAANECDYDPNGWGEDATKYPAKTNCGES